jgi:hypothetical protein
MDNLLVRPAWLGLDPGDTPRAGYAATTSIRRRLEPETSTAKVDTRIATVADAAAVEARSH